MDGGLLVCRLILAGSFAGAGLRRLADPLGARRAMNASGVPPRLVNVAVTVLTLVEAVVAVGLMSGETAWLAAVTAIACLVVGVLPTAVDMARHGTRSTGLPAVVRATMLAIPASVVAVSGYADAGPDIVPWVAHLATAQQI